MSLVSSSSNNRVVGIQADKGYTHPQVNWNSCDDIGTSQDGILGIRFASFGHSWVVSMSTFTKAFVLIWKSVL